MVSAMSVFASGGYNYTVPPTGTDPYEAVSDYDKGGLVFSDSAEGYGDWDTYFGNYPPSDVDENKKSYWVDMSEDDGVEYQFVDGQWVRTVYDEETGEWVDIVYTGRFGPADSHDSKSDDGPRPLSDQDIAAINQRAEAEAVQRAANDEGFADLGDMYQAAEKNLSAGEFYNNAVTSTPGIENAVTVGQGGNLIVDGQVTNMSATISKVTNRAYVDSVRIEQEGRVLNVVDVSYPAVNATINFYMPGITGAENIVALQYSAGTWVNVEVVEVRADHVTLNMKGNGVVAFIAK